MLITLGPLVIQPANTSQLKALWLKPPAYPNGPAVATVWNTKAPDAAPGNAAIMAYASELYTLAIMLAAVKSAEEAGAAKKHAKALVQRIEEAAP